MTRGTETNFIVNDDPSIAAEVGADGVHVGQADMPVSEVRRLYPSIRIVGLSTHSPEPAVASVALVVSAPAVSVKLYVNALALVFGQLVVGANA